MSILSPTPTILEAGNNDTVEDNSGPNLHKLKALCHDIRAKYSSILNRSVSYAHRATRRVSGSTAAAAGFYTVCQVSLTLVFGS